MTSNHQNTKVISSLFLNSYAHVMDNFCHTSNDMFSFFDIMISKPSKHQSNFNTFLNSHVHHRLGCHEECVFAPFAWNTCLWRCASGAGPKRIGVRHWLSECHAWTMVGSVAARNCGHGSAAMSCELPSELGPESVGKPLATNKMNPPKHDFGLKKQNKLYYEKIKLYYEKMKLYYEKMKLYYEQMKLYYDDLRVSVWKLSNDITQQDMGQEWYYRLPED